MSVRLTHRGLPTDITPYQLKRFLKRARVSLGLSKGAIEYLVFAIDNCQKSDFLRGRICAIWHSPERLSQIFGLSKRQVGRIEAELVDAGLIRRTYPERKSRSGDRVDGVIKRAAGINLAPLIEQAEYVRSLVSRQMQTDENHKHLREHSKARFGCCADGAVVLHVGGHHHPSQIFERRIELQISPKRRANYAHACDLRRCAVENKHWSDVEQGK